MADVGLISMQKILTVGMALILIFVMLGCMGGGEITPEMQKQKSDGLRKLSEEHPDPNRQKRPGG